MMRILLKILLFPFTLALSIAVALLRLANHLSGMVLTLLALVVLATGIGTLIFLGDKAEASRILFIAFMVSPFGVPLIFTFLIELLALFKDALKAM